MKTLLLTFLVTLLFLINLTAQESQEKYQRLDAIALWPNQELDQGKIKATIKNVGLFQNVTSPAIITYLPPKHLATGTSVLICPGGGYGALAWAHHVERLAPLFTSKGIALIGLKYRTNHPQNKIPDDALKDFNQAIRLIRKNSKEWNLHSEKIIGLGFSAGANLLLQYACSPGGEKIKYLNFLCLWPFFQKAEAYSIQKKDLDVIMFTTAQDKVAPSSFSVDIAGVFRKSGSKVKLIQHNKGTHMAFNFEANGPRVDWTADFFKWMKIKGLYNKK